MKQKLGINVYEASKQRIAYTFDNFEKIIVSFSAGKDSWYVTRLDVEIEKLQ